MRSTALIMHKKRNKRILILSFIFLLPLLLFVVLDKIFPLPPYTNGYSTVVYSNDNEIIHGYLSSDDKWRIRADYNEISGDLSEAIIFKEDKYFWYHPGINLFSVARALWNNTISGRRTSGASTITMQVARMLNPDNRTLKSKIRESYRALQLEWHYSKKEILTLYLNLLPYGGNIEGVKTASLMYFGQEPKELSAAQTVMLTVIPNNPNVLMPKNRSKLLNCRNYWLLQMGKSGIFTSEEVDDALLEGFGSTRYSISQNASHLSNRLHLITLKSARNNTKNNSLINYTVPDRIYSTLDLAIQSKVESSISNYIRTLRSLQITNAAVLVVNNRTMEVKAYAGSAGFDETQFSGQVDGVRALRSPGSALKPALYMLAFDKGYVSPKTIVSDVPVNFNGYRPENYDESYRGKVSIEQALALSLNVPAVELLDKIGINDLNLLLANAGFNWITKNRKKTGLSLILGGCGTTLEEMTALYASFANKGIWEPLKYSKEKVDEKSQKIVLGSSGSTYMITEILTSLKRPDLPNEYREAADLPRIAWKTGTSYGRRDAWAIGYNADYTVGVWAGNFDGRGVPELNGSDCAVPLLFMIFNQLQIKNSDWFFLPPDADFRLVCSETGMIPDTFCHNRVMETFLPGISPSIRCNHMKLIFTDNKEQISYCRECLPETGYKTVLFPNYSPELISYYEEMKIPYKRIPDHNLLCNALEDEEGPKITSLTDGAEYLVFAGRKQQLLFKSSCRNGVKTIYWYVDKKFYKKCSPNESVYFMADKGLHSISCSDDRGRTSSINIKVTLI